MTARNPLVLVSGQLRELPAGDSLNASTTVTTILDADYASVSLLLHGNGSNGSTTFTDNSPSPLTVTSVSGAQISTTQSKFGGASMNFSGSNYVNVAASSNMSLGTAPFTAEFFVYATGSYAGTPVILDWFYKTSPYQAGSWRAYIAPSGLATFIVAPGGGSTSYEATSSGTVTTNAWNHVAVCRVGNNITVYLNGVGGSALNYTGAVGHIYSGSLGAATLPGGGGSPGQHFTGYVDDVRITKGVARYTANFTPPALPFADAYSRTDTFTQQSELMLPEFSGGVRDTTATTGTGSFTLDGETFPGFVLFGSVYAIGQSLNYFVQGTTGEWESGTGTLSGSGLTLSRDTVWASSNGGTPTNFSAGSKAIFALPNAGAIRHARLGRQYANARAFALP